MTISTPAVPLHAPASRRDIFAWAMFDFANSSYTTVVLTAIFNGYFVRVVAGDHDVGMATLFWTLAVSAANILVLLSAPVLGAIADHGAHKKRFLVASTVGCVVFTFLLGTVGPGEVAVAMLLVILATLMFSTGENLIAAFLPEIASPRDMGKVSGYGWTLGYVGGLLVLGVCLIYIAWARQQGQDAAHYVPVTMWITALTFALAAIPTFLWLPERARPLPLPPGKGYVRAGFDHARDTLRHARRYPDLFRFLVALAVYYCGVYIVIVLAGVYAVQVMGFGEQETIVLILVVNLAAAAGALGFGLLQDRLGSVATLALTLLLWIGALVLAYGVESRAGFWVAAHLIGLAMGSSQSAGRALVGQLAPPAHAAEFFGLWGLATKLAAAVGPLVYGGVVYVTHGNQRVALLATTGFFVVGLLMLASVNERRGKTAALVVY